MQRFCLGKNVTGKKVTNCLNIVNSKSYRITSELTSKPTINPPSANPDEIRAESVRTRFSLKLVFAHIKEIPVKNLLTF